MAKEYIDREEVIAWLDGLAHNMENRLIHTPKKDATFARFETRLAERKSIADAIRIKPAADVAPVVHARWIKEGGDMHYSGHMIFCSKCGKRHFVFGKHYFSFSCLELCTEPNYCPNCGAKMDGGAEDAV